MKYFKLKIIIVTGIILAAFLSCIKPVYPKEQVLQHSGTLVLLIPLLTDLRKKWMNMYSFAGLAIFIIIHIIGARYIYSNVPYNEWINSVMNFNINQFCGFERNQYDRFVHFAYGVLFFPLFYQMISKIKGFHSIYKIAVAWAFIQTFSMLYELFEWMLTLVMSNEAADNYNGQQGDIWDAQKDMFLAMLSSTITAIIFIIKKINLKSEINEL